MLTPPPYVDRYRKGATIGYVQPDGVAGKDGRIKVGDVIQVLRRGLAPSPSSQWFTPSPPT